jgi:phage terminase large subunit
MEEATEFDEIDFDTLDAGLSAVCEPGPQMYFTFNPVAVVAGSQHWLQKRFPVEGRQIGELNLVGDVALLRSNFQCNAFCPKENVKLLESYRENNPSLWKMWGLGEFTTVEGVILNNWDVVDTMPDRKPDYCGLDFGFADDPAAVVKVWVAKEELWVEEVVYANGLTNQQLCLAMQEAGVRRQEDRIVADCAEPKSIAEIRTDGFVVIASAKGADYKHAAAQWLNNRRLHIARNSTNLQREVATWAWKQDKLTGRKLPVPMDGNDHCIDAMIYAAYRRETRPMTSLYAEVGHGNGKRVGK